MGVQTTDFTKDFVLGSLFCFVFNDFSFMIWVFTNLLLQYLHIAKNVQTPEERTDSYILCRTVYVVLLHTGSEGAVEAVEV